MRPIAEMVPCFVLHLALALFNPSYRSFKETGQDEREKRKLPVKEMRKNLSRQTLAIYGTRMSPPGLNNQSILVL
ncbi:hypothetical protein GGI42DRAFT_336402 [Trichoderma sp. SZMC 28013]